MISEDDIAEIVLESLKTAPVRSQNFRTQLSQSEQRQGKWGFHVRERSQSYTSLPARRLFLSEYEIRKMLRPGQKQLRIPANAIVSPLAAEWLDEKGIAVIRE